MTENPNCPNCGSDNVNHVYATTFICKQCRGTFQDFSGGDAGSNYQWVPRQQIDEKSLMQINTGKKYNRTLALMTIFDTSCKVIPSEDVDMYIDRNLRFADTLREKGYFNEAETYYNKVLKVHEGSVRAGVGRYLSRGQCHSYNDQRFEYVILNIDFNSNDKTIHNAISKDREFMEAAVARAVEMIKREKSTDKAIAFFDNAVEYIPEEYDSFYIKTVRDLVFILIANKNYKQAEKYINKLLTDDKKDDVAYLGKVLIAAKSRNLTDLILQSNEILEFDDFNNALNCSDVASEKNMKLYNWQVYLSTDKKIRTDTEVNKKDIHKMRYNLTSFGFEGLELLNLNDAHFKRIVETGNIDEETAKHGQVMGTYTKMEKRKAAANAASARKTKRKGIIAEALHVIFWSPFSIISGAAVTVAGFLISGDIGLILEIFGVLGIIRGGLSLTGMWE